MRDNQNRNLAALRHQMEVDEMLRKATAADAHRRHLELIKVVPYADWTEIDGVLVLRSGDSNFVAVPTNGASTKAKGEQSSRFDVISLEPREFVVQLKNKEVRTWLWKKHIAEKDL